MSETNFKLYNEVFLPNYNGDNHPLVARLVYESSGTKVDASGNTSQENDNVIRGFIDEDALSVMITSKYQQQSSTAGKYISDFVDQGRKKVLDAVLSTQSIKGVLDTGLNFTGDNFLTKLNSQVNNSKEFSDIRKSVNQVIEVGDDFTYIFEGSSISVPNTMEVKLLADSEESDILDRLKSLISHVVGDYKLNENGDGFGMQLPPNDFETVVGINRESTPGTATLYVGDPNNGGMIFNGIVISQATINISNIKVKLKSGKIAPLYVTCSLQLEQVTKYDKSLLLKNLGIE